MIAAEICLSESLDLHHTFLSSTPSPISSHVQRSTILHWCHIAHPHPHPHPRPSYHPQFPQSAPLGHTSAHSSVVNKSCTRISLYPLLTIEHRPLTVEYWVSKPLSLRTERCPPRRTPPTKIKSQLAPRDWDQHQQQQLDPQLFLNSPRPNLPSRFID